MCKGSLGRVRSDTEQAKCDSFLPKGLAGIQGFFEPCKQALLLINLACFNPLYLQNYNVPHTVKSH